MTPEQLKRAVYAIIYQTGTREITDTQGIRVFKPVFASLSVVGAQNLPVSIKSIVAPTEGDTADKFRLEFKGYVPA